ncbi:MAG: type 4a pilus biogenesis protein PilO [Armatimonadetes bacterium]|nr:type 4a pilus biogenesis protein PilO [Armatimonadota bacterium]
MMKISRRERVMILVAVVAVAGVGIDWLISQPVVAPLLEGNLKARLAAEEAKGRKYATEADLLRKDIRRLERRVKTMTASQPPHKILPVAMKAVQSVARSSGVVLSEIRPLRQEEEDGWVRLPIELRLQERFPKVIAFLYALESPARKMAVRKVRLASGDGKSDRVDVQVQIEVIAAAEGGNEVETPGASDAGGSRTAEHDSGSVHALSGSLKLTRGAFEKA